MVITHNRGNHIHSLYTEDSTRTVTQTLQRWGIQQLYVIAMAGTLRVNTDCDVWSKTGVFYEALELGEHDITRSKPSGEYMFPCSLYNSSTDSCCVYDVCVSCIVVFSMWARCLSLHEGPRATAASRGGACARAAPCCFFFFFFLYLQVLGNDWKKTKLNDGDGWCGGSITHFRFISWKTIVIWKTCLLSQPPLAEMSESACGE